MTEKEEQLLTEVSEKMKNDTSPYIDYDTLQPSRKWWLRRLNTITGIVTGTIATSAIISPGIVDLISHYSDGANVDFRILVLIGSIGIMTGSEVTKLVADQGPLVAVPTQCAFATLLGLPIYGIFLHHPEVAFRTVFFAAAILLLAEVTTFWGPQLSKSTNPLHFIAPPVKKLLFSTVLPVLTPGTVSPIEFLVVPLCFYGTWTALQRNLKLSKWNPDLENLDRRIPSAVGIHLFYPLVLMCLLVFSYSLKKRYEKKSDASEIQEIGRKLDQESMFIIKKEDQFQIGPRPDSEN